MKNTIRRTEPRTYRWMHWVLGALVILAAIGYGISIAALHVFPYGVLHKTYSVLVLREYTEYTQPTYGATDVASLINIHNSTQLHSKRAQLIHTIWGSEELPQEVPSARSTNTLPNMKNLARVDVLRIEMQHGITSNVRIFVPKKSNGAAAIYASGHESGELPGREIVAALVLHGFTVAHVEMPLHGGNSKPVVSLPAVGYLTLTYHNQFWLLEKAGPYPIRFFMHPLALTANYLVQSHDAIVMVGFSGGGWETTLYAAIDPRIERSYPVAGSLPSYLRSQRDWGDYEQFSPRLYDAANYLELYVLGASEGRSQLQILNRYDSCCFAGEGYKTYETVVASRARALGGTFSVYSDDTHTVHQLSGRARDIILSDLLKVYPDAAQ